MKRFIPSEWGVDFSYPDEQLPLPPPWKDLKREALSELRKYASGREGGGEGKGGLEYTLVHNGFFMDYFGMPYVDSYMSPEVPFIDIQACKAAIPGTGDENKVVFTYTRDVARFVRRLVEMGEEERWMEKSVVVGDRVTMNEVLEGAEMARGMYSFPYFTHNPPSPPSASTLFQVSRNGAADNSLTKTRQEIRRHPRLPRQSAQRQNHRDSGLLARLRGFAQGVHAGHDGCVWRRDGDGRV